MAHGTDIYWTGTQAKKFYRSSGFSATVEHSADVSAIDATVTGVDLSLESEVVWTGSVGAKLYHASGDTATLQNSVALSTIDNSPQSIYWESVTDVDWTGTQADKLYKSSGFTATISDSVDQSAVDTDPAGITCLFEIGTDDHLWSGTQAAKLYRTSGFTSALNDSADVSGVDNDPSGISWSDPNAIWSGGEADKLYTSSGFSATVIDSADVSAVDNIVTGIAFGGRWWYIGVPHLGSVFKPRKIPVARSRNTGAPLIDFGRRYHTARGMHRIANTAAYWFYRANTTTRPASPYDTNSAIAYSPTDTFADGTWYLWTTYFNGFLESDVYPVGATGESYLRLDIASTEEYESPPQGPGEWRLGVEAGGVVRVYAAYYQSPSDDLRAVQWSMAVTFNGSNPTAEANDEFQAMPSSGLALLAFALDAQANGTTVKVILQTRRNNGTDESPDWVYSENTTDIKTATADATGPSAVSFADSYRGGIREDN